jgi:uncharacterized protein involved in exopolysaccharide biosynthesis
MSQLVIGVLLGGLVAALLAFAPQVSGSLVRSRARRLPPTLSSRMEEEWLAELATMSNRPSQLAFAIALTLTRRHSFSMDDDSLALASRSSATVATIGGWPSVVVASTLVFAAIAYGASFLVQPMYRSTARFGVAPPRIPAAFVASPVVPLHDQLPRIREQVLSSTSLERVLLDAPVNDLRRPAVDVARPRVSEDVIEGMRRDVDIQLLPDGQSLEISYLSPDPRQAMKVARRLASLYIETSTYDRGQLADAPAEFLDAQIGDLRSRLITQRAEIPSASNGHAPDADVRLLEHEQLKSIYRELLMKRERALLSVELARRQIGEQAKLVDVPRLPDTPISPNRRLIAGEGAGAGFFLGVTMMLAGRSGSFRRLTRARVRS